MSSVDCRLQGGPFYSHSERPTVGRPRADPRCESTTPPVVIRGFGNNYFVPRYLQGGNGVCVFRPTTRSRPRLGLVVRCGDLALSQKKHALLKEPKVFSIIIGTLPDSSQRNVLLHFYLPTSPEDRQ